MKSALPLVVLATLLAATGATSPVCNYSSENLLVVPKLGGRIACTQLDISNNSITTLNDTSFRPFPRLVTLWAFTNEISNLKEGTFTPLVNLTVVYLSSNRLRVIPRELFKHSNKSLKLYLNNNSIVLPETGSFLNAPTLERLDLSSCNITVIPRDTFIGLPKLKDLNLSQNKLREISKDVFQLSHNLKYFNVSNNVINTLKFIASMTLSTLNLSAFNIPMKTLDISELQYVRELRELIMSAEVCCCSGNVCKQSLKLSGKEWYQRCTNCQHTMRPADNGTKDIYIKEPINVSEVVETSHIPRLTTPPSYSKTSTSSGSESKVKDKENIIISSANEVESNPAEGQILKIICIVLLIVLLVVVIGGVIAVVAWRRRRRKRSAEKARIPACPCCSTRSSAVCEMHYPYSNLIRPVSRDRPPYLEVNHGRFQTHPCMIGPVTDLDAEEEANYVYGSNIYEAVDDENNP